MQFREGAGLYVWRGGAGGGRGVGGRASTQLATQTSFPLCSVKEYDITESKRDKTLAIVEGLLEGKGE